MPLSNTISQTKFYIPHLPKEYIDRRELVSRFMDNQSHCVFLVSAPSGYGKSLFVADIINKVDTAAWVSFELKDNNLSTFIYSNKLQVFKPLF